MSEYDRIYKMHHQLYIMKKNKKTILSQWRKSRELLEAVMKTLSPKEENLKHALEMSVTALLQMQAQEQNPPLKRVHLESMNGEPVWVVGYEYDGRWGIVNTGHESIMFPTSEGVEEEEWFDGMYIFKYKKEIKDYTEILEKYGLQDDEEFDGY